MASALPNIGNIGSSGTPTTITGFPQGMQISILFGSPNGADTLTVKITRGSGTGNGTAFTFLNAVVYASSDYGYLNNLQVWPNDIITIFCGSGNMTFSAQGSEQYGAALIYTQFDQHGGARAASAA